MQSAAHQRALSGQRATFDGLCSRTTLVISAAVLSTATKLQRLALCAFILSHYRPCLLIFTVFLSCCKFFRFTIYSLMYFFSEHLQF